MMSIFWSRPANNCATPATGSRYAWMAVAFRSFRPRETATALRRSARLKEDLIRREVHLIAAHLNIPRAVFPSKIWNSIALERGLVGI